MTFQGDTLVAAPAELDDPEHPEKTLATHRTGLAQLRSGCDALRVKHDRNAGAE